MTFDDILNRMLDRVPSTVDKREGSIIYNALAPAAAELSQIYMEITHIDMATFAEKATGDFLAMRCAERGVIRKEATKAIRKGEFNISIAVGDRFSIEDLTYIATEKITENQFKLECEQPGEVGNIYSGSLIPIDYIDGLENATLTDVLIPSDDIEDDEELRKRYFDTLESESFGGNIADYKKATKELNGVGGVKVYPVWNGGGTVKLMIIDSAYNKPSTQLITDVQTSIDPVTNQGEGVGIAPIGHVVTVAGVDETTVDITSTITLENGYIWADVQILIESAINDYFTELKSTWDSIENIVVRISQIDSKILGLAGVLDIQNTKINTAAVNFVLGTDNIPKLGVVTNG